MITFEINRRTLSGAIVVSDKQAAAAMRDAATFLKLVVEPGGVVGLAALASKELDIAGSASRSCCRAAMSISTPMPGSLLRRRSIQRPPEPHQRHRRIDDDEHRQPADLVADRREVGALQHHRRARPAGNA